MKHKILLLVIFPVIMLSSCRKESGPVNIHPENPHYFLFRNSPAILVGSTEHYGAVMNLDFDYVQYLDELKRCDLNVTRTFSGIYVEPQGAFNIEKNTLAPAQGRFICPWQRSDQPGYKGGGNKFDLERWDTAYFNRLKDFIIEAGKRSIIVELDLFSNFYDTVQWQLSPLYFANNINNTPVIEDHKEVLSLRHPELLSIQEKMVKKILEECNGFDNLYYEVCNEPYFGDLEALDAWEYQMTGFIDSVEDQLPLRHLISQNIQNGKLKVENPHPAVSIFNFHYAKPPVTVEMNFELNKPIGDNETGFSGTEDVHYRTEGWDFMVAGGALYNNLDYSFTTGTEDGSFAIPQNQPGGGGKTLRSQLKIMKDVISELDFIKMEPADYTLKPRLPEAATVRVLSETGKQYLLYINNWHPKRTNKADQGNNPASEITIPLDLPSGNYRCEWIDPVTGQRSGFDVKNHPGGIYSFSHSGLREDLALKITK